MPPPAESVRVLSPTVIVCLAPGGAVDEGKEQAPMWQARAEDRGIVWELLMMRAVGVAGREYVFPEKVRAEAPGVSVWEESRTRREEGLEMSELENGL